MSGSGHKVTASDEHRGAAERSQGHSARPTSGRTSRSKLPTALRRRLGLRVALLLGRPVAWQAAAGLSCHAAGVVAARCGNTAWTGRLLDATGRRVAVARRRARTTAARTVGTGSAAPHASVYSRSGTISPTGRSEDATVACWAAVALTEAATRGDLDVVRCIGDRTASWPELADPVAAQHSLALRKAAGNGHTAVCSYLLSLWRGKRTRATTQVRAGSDDMVATRDGAGAGTGVGAGVGAGAGAGTGACATGGAPAVRSDPVSETLPALPAGLPPSPPSPACFVESSCRSSDTPGGGATQISSVPGGCTPCPRANAAACSNFALIKAARNGHAAVVRLLLGLPTSRGVTADAMDSRALRLAASAGHLAAVEALLAIRGTGESGALSAASKVSESGRAASCTAGVADIASHGYYALRVAAAAGHVGVVDVLLARLFEGGDPDWDRASRGGESLREALRDAVRRAAMPETVAVLQRLLAHCPRHHDGALCQPFMTEVERRWRRRAGLAKRVGRPRRLGASLARAGPQHAVPSRDRKAKGKVGSGSRIRNEHMLDELLAQEVALGRAHAESE